MRNQDNIGCIFVNTVVGRGSLNNVVNLSFSTFNFSPNDKGEIELDPAVSCRLRMDKFCAVQLRDQLNALLSDIEAAEAKAAMGVADQSIEGVVAKPRAEEIN